MLAHKGVIRPYCWHKKIDQTGLISYIFIFSPSFLYFRLAFDEIMVEKGQRSPHGQGIVSLTIDFSFTVYSMSRDIFHGVLRAEKRNDFAYWPIKAIAFCTESHTIYIHISDIIASWSIIAMIQSPRWRCMSRLHFTRMREQKRGHWPDVYRTDQKIIYVCGEGEWVSKDLAGSRTEISQTSLYRRSI